jgi:alkanesulfonate monooxygenase SsuD/methylene tetrahydromethanopterin reductase-like flavin-dependent oxidoreductase (luciferase family)
MRSRSSARRDDDGGLVGGFIPAHSIARFVIALIAPEAVAGAIPQATANIRATAGTAMLHDDPRGAPEMFLKEAAAEITGGLLLQSIFL